MTVNPQNLTVSQLVNNPRDFMGAEDLLKTSQQPANGLIMRNTN
jgi:hypothetical protein